MTPRDRPVNVSPRVLAGTGGVLYLIIILLGIVGEAFIRDRIIVPGDATSTAGNLRSMESLWRFGIASELFLLMCSVVLALILYVLLRPVGRDLALLAAFFNLVSLSIEGAYSLQLIEVLFPQGNAPYLKAFTPEQLHAMASLSARSHVYGFGIALSFFGCFCLVAGQLIFRSGYLPRVVGVLMQIAGVAYLTNTFALILNPSFADRIFPVVAALGFVGEASLCLRLLLKGVNVQRWNEAVTRSSIAT